MYNNEVPDGYHVVWVEEFSGDSLHVRNWNYVIRDASESKNNELQEYAATDKQVRIENGRLVIHPSCEKDEDGNIKYYSGSITTKGQHEFKYCRMEIRMKLPSGQGLLPAVRLRPADEEYGIYPASGQIDIMGSLGKEPEKVYTTVHYGTPHAQKQGVYHLDNKFGHEDGFHDYVLEWNPDSMRFYIDGDEYFRVNDWFSQSADGTRYDYPAPFDKPFYIDISLAIGGYFTGAPDETTVFDESADLVIDRIRVLQKDQYEEPNSKRRIPRKTIAVLGSWEDAENLSMFIGSLQMPGLLQRYVLTCFTFGIAGQMDDDDIAVELEFVDFIMNMDHAAIMIFAEMIKTPEIIEKLIEEAHKRKIPVFVFERKAEGAINVRLKYADGFEKAVRHVIEDHGCREVDMFAGFRGNEFSEERIGIYKKVLSENGIPFEEKRLHYGDYWDVTASQVLGSLIDSGYKLPQAFVCANDSMAVGVCDCLYGYSIRVPEDIIVTGFDGIWQSEYHSPSITTAGIDYDSMVNNLIERIDNWDPDRDSGRTEEIDASYKLKLNHSCGCVDRDSKRWGEIVSDLAMENQDYFRHMLEMGRFITGSISKSDIDEVARELQHYLWLWKWQYYFVATNEGDDSVHAVFHGKNGEYLYGRTYYDMEHALPDWDEIICEDSGVNILLFKQIKTHSDNIGYVVEGMDKINLRAQQRFEEFALFISAVINSVNNNRKLIKAGEEIERMAEMDYLTGLYNRRGFLRELDRRINDPKNKGRCLTLFSVDMDNLKYINDTFGHHSGDLAIQALAQGIRAATGDNGFCARYGGDEFAFAVIADASLFEQADRIRALIELEANRLINITDGNNYEIRASIGAGDSSINRRLDFEGLLKNTDYMMYKDKQARKLSRG